MLAPEQSSASDPTLRHDETPKPIKEVALGYVQRGTI